MGVSGKRHITLEGYLRIIESTTRQIVNEFGVMTAEHALRQTSEKMRKEVVKMQEPRT